MLSELVITIRTLVSGIQIQVVWYGIVVGMVSIQVVEQEILMVGLVIVIGELRIAVVWYQI